MLDESMSRCTCFCIALTFPWTWTSSIVQVFTSFTTYYSSTTRPPYSVLDARNHALHLTHNRL
ncbi:hypothetical protein BDV59DRAFT_65399 [Aspergillus ambiguus]|uniref:uncharacterized protein n=1 Tax=Aspergillus ambiguus TaxID=176160 RepID=UPI003CCD48AB